MVPVGGSMYDVVIVGAGIAGLTAAEELRKRSNGKPVNILILEAKDRVGGRTETVTMRTSTATDQFDLGGQWVGVTQFHILDLLRNLRLDIFPQFVDGLKVSQMGSSTIRTYSDGIPTTLKALIQFSPLEIISLVMFVRDVDRMAAKLNPLAPFDTPEAADWDSLTVLEFVIRRSTYGRCRFVQDVVDVVCRTVYGVSSDRLSLLYFVLYGKNSSIVDLCGATGSGSQAFRIVGGAQQICRLLAENVGWEKIRLGHPVWKIQHGSDGAEISIIGKLGFTSVTAKRIILAIPPQQISRILFQPSLPEDQIQLFAAFTPGNLFKFNITYTTPFWRERGLSGEITATGMTEDPQVLRPVSITYDATTSHGNAAVVGFLNTEWCGSDPTTRREAVIEDLIRYLGPEAADYIDYVDKSWSEEPYSGGCPVGVVPPGVGSYYASSIRRVTGPIHFAGTETAREWIGYMSGAVESGLRAAHEVMAILTPAALTQSELEAVRASMDQYQTKRLAKGRCYKKSTWFTWKTAAVACTVGAVAAVVFAKRVGFQTPIKIRVIYSL